MRAAFFAADPAGFFAAEVDGALVAAISVVNHSDRLAFLGLYLCQTAYRGRGIGYALWQHALAHAGDRVVGLDGVPDQQPNYRKSGFVWAMENRRFTGVLPRAGAVTLRPTGSGDLAGLMAMEAAANGFGKQRFMENWLADTPSRQTLVLGGAPRAFATLRRCRSGYKIGPLVAESPADAAAALGGLGRLTRDAPVMIDIPGDQPDLAGMCASLGHDAELFHRADVSRACAPARPGFDPQHRDFGTGLVWWI
jgi:hypothetical protein